MSRGAIVYLLIALVCLSTGCSRVVVNGMRVREDWWLDVQHEISLRARIDLSCREVDVVLQKMQGKFPVIVTADGCGRSVLYQRQLRRSVATTQAATRYGSA